MLIFWRQQSRNQKKLEEPKFGDDFLRAWVRRNDFQMRKGGPLEELQPVSDSTELETSTSIGQDIDP